MTSRRLHRFLAYVIISCAIRLRHILRAYPHNFLFSIGVAHAPLRDPSAQSLRLSIGEATIDGLVLLFVAMNGKC